MKTNRPWLERITQLGLLLTMGISMNADAGLFGFSGFGWKEEVLLHDGSKIVVKRNVERAGRHELGQRPPIGNQSISFTMPGTSQNVVWEDKYSEDVGSANFNLMMLEILNGTAYLVGSPMGCLPYNKWGRPNPPYVIFQYQSKEWKRITLQELPSEFRTPNLIISSPDESAEKVASDGLVSAVKIKELNAGFRQPEYQTILREPVKGAGITGCEKMVPYGKSGWLGLDWFSEQPNYEACVRFCEKKGVSAQHCPCAGLFKGVK